MRASLMYAFRRAYDLTYKMATFRAKRGLFNRVYRQFVLRYAYVDMAVKLYPPI